MARAGERQAERERRHRDNLEGRVQVGDDRHELLEHLRLARACGERSAVRRGACRAVCCPARAEVGEAEAQQRPHLELRRLRARLDVVVEERERLQDNSLDEWSVCARSGVARSSPEGAVAGSHSFRTPQLRMPTASSAPAYSGRVPDTCRGRVLGGGGEQRACRLDVGIAHVEKLVDLRESAVDVPAEERA